MLKQISFGAQLVNTDTFTIAPAKLVFGYSHFMLNKISFGAQLVNTDTLTTAPVKLVFFHFFEKAQNVGF